MADTDIAVDLWDRNLGLDNVNGGRNLVLKTKGAFQPQGNIVSATAATLTVTRKAHGERTVVLNRAAGVTATLPAATGSGARYRFVVGTTVTSNNDIIQVANSSDYMRGVAQVVGSANAGFQTANTGTVATESDTVTMNGTTTGGVAGGTVELEDIAANVWQVRCVLDGSGTAATPFSAAV